MGLNSNRIGYKVAMFACRFRDTPGQLGLILQVLSTKQGISQACTASTIKKVIMPNYLDSVNFINMSLVYLNCVMIMLLWSFHVQEKPTRTFFFSL